MLFISIGICLFAFVFVIAIWTVLPRHGTIEIPGEGVYIGQLRGYTFHGYGAYKNCAVSGTSYEGEWKNGVFHGQGELTFANGSQLSGKFVNGFLQGNAFSICPDGHIHEVYFADHEQFADCEHDH